MIPPAALKEFQSIITKDYGTVLSDVQALEFAQNFLIALEAVLKPTPPAPKLTITTERSKSD